MAEKRQLSLTVPDRLDGRRVKSVLKTEFHMAESFIARLKLRERGILRNGQRVFTDAVLHTGDVLTVSVEDPPEAVNPAEPIPAVLPVIYQDEDLAVFNKPAGMAVHGVSGGATTVANALAAIWGRGQPFHPVHRLDRGTSGLLVVAKSAYVHELLRREMHTDAFHREYLALTAASPEPPAGTVDLPIGKEEGHPTRRRVSEGGQPARTEFETIDCFSGGAVLRLRPLTGRTHQIRVHMAAIGCPLLGDALYGGPVDRISRPALHAWKKELCQPITGNKLILTAPLPPDFQALAGGSLKIKLT